MKLRRGFSLLEMVVVLIIVFVLACFSLVAIQRSRNAAYLIACSNKLRQVGVGLVSHSNSFGSFPPRKPSIADSEGSTCTYEGIGWQVYILPYIEQQSLWNNIQSAYNSNKDPYPDLLNPSSAAHVRNTKTIVDQYVCPQDQRLFAVHNDSDRIFAGYTSYVGVTGNSEDPKCGIFGKGIGVYQSQVTEGLSQTLIIGERPPPSSYSMGWWYTAHRCSAPSSVNDYEAAVSSGIIPGDPRCTGDLVDHPEYGLVRMYYFKDGSINNDCDKMHYWSLHHNGANFLFADGSVKFVKYAAMFVLDKLASIRGSEIVSDESY